ncbi:hypothetical protein NBH16_17860, partial [Parabacteroides sp. Y3-G-102]|nr:hypothetical protein [Parabacteroides sp. Y3-G-102]
MRNMKKNYLLSAAAAFLLAVTGCSDDIENGGNSGGEGDSGKVYILKSATKLFSVLLASKRPLITELADKLRLKYPLLPTISPCP